MTATAPRGGRDLLAELEALPPNVVGEILAGELVVSPRPVHRHARAAAAVAVFVVGPFGFGLGGPGGWVVLPEPELRLGIDPAFRAVVPDLAGWRAERAPADPDAAIIDVVPDWICEILLPSTELHDRRRKLPFFHRAGVGHAWLVQPGLRMLEVYRRGEAGWTQLGVWSDGDRVRAEPFEAVELKLAQWWMGDPPEDSPAKDR